MDSGAKPEVIDSLHHLKALAGKMRQALLAGDLDGLGHLLDEGWQYKKRLSARISSGAIDSWYGAARAAGALGGKITGAGGGGFLLLYAPPERRASVQAAMARFGLREMTFDFDPDGAREITGGWRAARLVGGTTALEEIIRDLQPTARWPDQFASIAPLKLAYREEGNHA
jgi:D-glycero-alpha-D-manno-heptose-7-phosphate kinase